MFKNPLASDLVVDLVELGVLLDHVSRAELIAVGRIDERLRLRAIGRRSSLEFDHEQAAILVEEEQVEAVRDATSDVLPVCELLSDQE